MAGPRRPVDVELTIVSARDLKNVNWRYGDVRPYAVSWVDPDLKVTTKVDSAGDTNPSWNEKLTIPVQRPLEDAELTIEVVHEKGSEQTKPLIGTARIRLTEILDEVGFDERYERTLRLKRPSGRPHGKLEVAIRLREKRWPEPQYPYPQPYGTRDYPPQGYAPNYAPYPSQQYPYASAPTGYPNPYGSPYAQPAPPQPAPYGGSSYGGSSYYNQGSSGYGSASAPAAPPVYGEPQKPKSSKFGLGTGLAVGAAAGILGGLALGEGIDYVEDKITDDVAEKVEDDQGYDDYDGGDGGDDY